MGVEFLSDGQAAAFGRFSGVPAREQLERYFLLDDADRALVRRRRGDHNRLGFSLQLTTVRFLGRFLADPLDVPWVVVEFLAEQLGITDPSRVKGYGARLPTRHEHAREIREAVPFRHSCGFVALGSGGDVVRQSRRPARRQAGESQGTRPITSGPMPLGSALVAAGRAV